MSTQKLKSVDVDGDNFTVSFGYDGSIVNGLRRLPYRSYDGQTKTWLVGLRPENVIPLAAVIKEHNFVVTPEAAQAIMDLKEGALEISRSPEVCLVGGGIKVNTQGKSKLLKDLKFNWSPVQEEGNTLTFSWNLDSENLINFLVEQGLNLGPDVLQSYNDFRGGLDSALESSLAVTCDLDFPVPDGLSYLNYQKAGIAYAMSRRNSLLGDEPGLGKTVQAVGVANAMGASKVLVICPASLKINWSREFSKWTTEALSVGIINKTFVPDTGVVILNFDVLKKNLPQLKKIQWDLIIVDEAHAFKNPKAARSKAFYEGGLTSNKLLFLTGTPIVNRPIEMQPLLGCLDPENFGNFLRYAFRYCNAVRGSYGWDFRGASNLEELQTKARVSVMVRRLKSDVLKDLPRKIRTVVTLDTTTAVAAEKRALSEEKEKAEILRILDIPQRLLGMGDFSKLSQIRHETALAKVPAVVSFVRDTFEDEKVIIFAHHKDVIDAFVSEFGEAAVSLTGSDSMKVRQEAVDRFQTDPSVRFFIGSIQAAGVGITLTASSNVVFAELDWVPGNMTQAEDRAHRIGQKDSVNVYHVVLSGSIDDHLANTLIEKQRVLDLALDATVDIDGSPIDLICQTQEEAPSVTLDFDFEVLTREGIRNREITEAGRHKAEARISRIEAALKCEAAEIQETDIEKIHSQLKLLAGVCDGAKERDGQGFNAIDASMGRLLASLPELSPIMAAYAKGILPKYAKQLNGNT